MRASVVPLAIRRQTFKIRWSAADEPFGMREKRV